MNVMCEFLYLWLQYWVNEWVEHFACHVSPISPTTFMCVAMVDINKKTAYKMQVIIIVIFPLHIVYIIIHTTNNIHGMFLVKEELCTMVYKHDKWFIPWIIIDWWIFIIKPFQIVIDYITCCIATTFINHLM